MLKTYGIPGPSQEQYPDYNERLAALVRTVEAEALLGHIPGGQYDGVLIDEAHDFEPEWLSLAVKMVNPNTKAFMIAYDDMQAIYKGRRRPVRSQLGIEAKGRTRVLKVNYRNTVQILGFARRIAEEVVGAPGVAANDEDPVLIPEDAGRQGVKPQVRRWVSIEAEGHAIAEWLLGRRKAGYELGADGGAVLRALDWREVCAGIQEARRAGGRWARSGGEAWGRDGRFCAVGVCGGDKGDA
jgi:hypothetical protein